MKAACQMGKQRTLAGCHNEVVFQKPQIVLSLKPEYWRLILAGEKKYEYRRVFCSKPVQAYIYLSSPEQEIAGFIDFDIPIVNTPSQIAAIAEEQHSGHSESILEYLDGKTKGYAIPILSYKEIKPISLKKLRDLFNFTPPQSYLSLGKQPELKKYLENSSIRSIK